jgi:hypothetical protein
VAAAAHRVTWVVWLDLGAPSVAARIGLTATRSAQLSGRPWREDFDRRTTEVLITIGMFAWLISHQTTVLFSHNKPAISNQPAVLFSQNEPAPAISHQPGCIFDISLRRGDGEQMACGIIEI